MTINLQQISSYLSTNTICYQLLPSRLLLHIIYSSHKNHKIGTMLVTKFIILWGSFCLGTQGLAVNMKYPSNDLRTRDDSTSKQPVVPGKPIPKKVTESDTYKDNEASTALKAVLEDQRKVEAKNDKHYVFAMYQPDSGSCKRTHRYASLFLSNAAYWPIFLLLSSVQIITARWDTPPNGLHDPKGNFHSMAHSHFIDGKDLETRSFEFTDKDVEDYIKWEYPFVALGASSLESEDFKDFNKKIENMGLSPPIVAYYWKKHLTDDFHR